MYKISFDKAVQEVGDLITWLNNQVGSSPKLQESIPNDMIMRAVHHIFENETHLSRGEILSPIARMPDMWRNALLEYVQQSSPYERMGLVLKNTIKNVGNSTCRIVRSVRNIPRRDIGSGEVSDAWIARPSYYNIEPGEEITLPPDRAFNALWKYGRYSKPVFLWELLGESRHSLPLIEVAYSADYMGLSDDGMAQEPKEIDSRKWQKQKIELAVSKVKSAKSKSEKKRIVSSLPDHWDIPDDLIFED